MIVRRCRASVWRVQRDAGADLHGVASVSDQSDDAVRFGLAELLRRGMRLGRHRAQREAHVERLPAVCVTEASDDIEANTSSRDQGQGGHLHVHGPPTQSGQGRVDIQDKRSGSERVGVDDDVQVQRVPGE